MSGPGDSASKRINSGEPTRSVYAEGHGATAENVEEGSGIPRGVIEFGTPTHVFCTETGRPRPPLDSGHLPKQHLAGRGIPEAASKGAEESDALVVPQTPANTRVTPVESVEGRGAANGTPAQGNAFRAQERSEALTKLGQVGQRAREKKQERFTNLFHLLKVPLLAEAYFRLKPDAAPGVDAVMWQEYGQGLEERLGALQDRLHRGNYHPLPVRRVFIPKTDGSLRPLGIPALEDKIVQMAVKMILEAIYEQNFVGFSYGFRPGRNQHQALDALAVALGSKVNWVFDADVRAFFDAVNHQHLRRCIERRVGDERLVRLLMKWLRAGVMVNGKVEGSEQGTPQGGVVSPLLANIFLHYVLDLWALQWRREHARGEMYIVRYCDDFVMGFQREEDVRAMRQALTGRFAEYGLELHPDKTRVIRFGRFAHEKVGQEGRRRPESFDFLGFTHFFGTDRNGRKMLLRRTSRKKRQAKLTALRKEMRRRKHDRVPAQHGWLSSVLRGHYAYYGVPGNF